MVLLSLRVVHTRLSPFKMDVVITTITDMEVGRISTSSLPALEKWLAGYAHLKPVLKPTQWDTSDSTAQDEAYATACKEALVAVCRVTCTDWTLERANTLDFDEAVKFAKAFATTNNTHRVAELLERIAVALERQRQRS